MIIFAVVLAGIMSTIAIERLNPLTRSERVWTIYFALMLDIAVFMLFIL